MPSNGQFVKELPEMYLRDSNDALDFPTETENHLCVLSFAVSDAALAAMRRARNGDFTSSITEMQPPACSRFPRRLCSNSNTML